jgi:triacylglycerol esterase/lipase EstA (alpha/beta hydrolase family)
MSKLEKRLKSEGFSVVNLGYASRSNRIEMLASETLPKNIQVCRDGGADHVHFVTHSMGGILVRHYLGNNKLRDLGRVVMISPPNGGSEVVDKFGSSFVYQWINGPAGEQLGTNENSFVKNLGDVTFDLGVIAGTGSVNPLFSWIIPGPDDGKVSVENTRVNGMRDHTTVPASHPFIMNNRQTIDQVIHYLRTGKFR